MRSSSTTILGSVEITLLFARRRALYYPVCGSCYRADLADGRRITADDCFGMSGLMSRDDVSTQIDRMLGRDSHAHRPRVLAWRPLIAALESAGISRPESELIASPLEIRYEPAAQRALEG